jgi:NMD protein affecting ribosome stability and mRNA decay
MVTTIKRTKEKGQRTPRSMDAYKEKGGLEGAAYCECGAVFRNKRWYREEGEATAKGGHSLVCPACRRIADRNPAGIICLRGSFLAAHEVEIENLVRNTVQAAGVNHPLGRVMDISKEKDGITITTTDAKLAQKIGREVFKSHGGDLHIRWTDDEELVRVTWSR